MRKGLLLLSALLTLVVSAHAQSWDAIKAQKSVYLCGEGYGETVQEADNAALKDLISQISVVVSASISTTEDELVSNGTFDHTSYVNSKIETYSSATLTNTERLVISNEPDAHVGRYIKRSELNKIFEGREQKILEYLRLAHNAEERGKVDDALRCYYWAFSLTKTLQNPNAFKDQEGHILMSWIPVHMGEIFDDISLSVAHVDGNNVDLNITFRGKPVTSLDYTYFDGRDWSNLFSAKDGRGVLELMPGMEVGNVQVKYEYAYRGQSHIDQDVEQVMGIVKGKALRKAYANVSLTNAPTATAASYPTTQSVEQTQQQLSASMPKLSEVSEEELNKVVGIVNDVVRQIRSRQYANANKYFTPTGAEMYRKLIHYGNARVLDYSSLTVTHFGDRLVVRSVPMSFSFAQGVRKSFVEDIVFTFNKDYLIESVAFGLDKEAMDDVMDKGAWSEEARQVLVSFLENYKTAYALKRIDYIESIFDDNAVIIVGSVVQRTTQSSADAKVFSSNKYVRRTQYTKERYLKVLENVFRSNEFVNIRFANNDIIKGGGALGETYGIQIKQDYYSTHYGDEGYLYLQVDMNNPDKPIIKVRTWQEEPDPEVGRPYGMQDF